MGVQSHHVGPSVVYFSADEAVQTALAAFYAAVEEAKPTVHQAKELQPGETWSSASGFVESFMLFLGHRLVTLAHDRGVGPIGLVIGSSGVPHDGWALPRKRCA